MGDGDSRLIRHANELILRAGDLDDAVSNLLAFKCMLVALEARVPLVLPPSHLQALGVSRAALLRSAIGCTIAILDQPGTRGDRASLGQILKWLDDNEYAALLVKPKPGRPREPSHHQLCCVRDRYRRLCDSDTWRNIKSLRHSIAHLLVQSEAEPQETNRRNLYLLADEIEKCVAELFHGIGLPSPEFAQRRQSLADAAVQFWNTYIRAAQS